MKVLRLYVKIFEAFRPIIKTKRLRGIRRDDKRIITKE